MSAKMAGFRISPVFLYVNAWTLLAFFRRSQDNIKSAYFRVSLGTPFVSSQFIWRDLTGCFIIEPFSLWWFSSMDLAIMGGHRSKFLNFNIFLTFYLSKRCETYIEMSYMCCSLEASRSMSLCFKAKYEK